MPSSYTSRLRLELQAAGENLSSWGVPRLNNIISRLEVALAGWLEIALTGDYSLTSSNSDDEARYAMLKFTGAGPWVVTTPSVSKTYVVWNACTDDLIITTGAGDTATISSGEMCTIASDGSNWKKVKVTNYNGARINGVADPVLDQDVATKKYVDTAAFTANAGILPGQPGNAGAFLKTDGLVASWGTVAGSDVVGLLVSHITDYPADQATRATAADLRAIAYAVSL